MMGNMIIRSQDPPNAEPSLDRLRASFLTPRDAFYVRCHGPVPELPAERFRLQVGGLVARPLDLSLQDLQRNFAKRTVEATLQCAGNRRAELTAVRPVDGDPWAGGAIGHAVWTGVGLGALLREAGARTDPDLFVVMESADRVDVAGEKGAVFGASIPMGKALDGDVLLAWDMNGGTLLPEHGFPLRAVVPGYAGVRSVKWLTKVSVSDAPANSPIQRRDYKLFPSDVTAEMADWEAGMTINEMPLTSVICLPAEGASVASGRTVVAGYAYASGRAITRVDVSSDGGRRWQQASIGQRAHTRWSWTFWEATLDLAPGPHELAVRAWDEAGQTQPASAAEVWNFKGYLCSSWHRIRVTAV